MYKKPRTEQEMKLCLQHYRLTLIHFTMLAFSVLLFFLAVFFLILPSVI